jgi:CRISPR-associated protein Cas1
VLVLESRQCTISSAALDALAAAGAVMIVCDRSHLPSSVLLPIYGNSLHAQRLRQQIAAPPALQRNLWAHIVRTKILGQAANIDSEPEALRLRREMQKVRPADPSNREAQAAKLYWSVVFRATPAHPFRRDASADGVNALLNYGYAIMRAGLGRALVASGLHPALGIHHMGRGNPFNLADDLLEAFRPMVDRVVRGMVLDGAEKIDQASRARLVAMLAERVSVGESEGPLLSAIAGCTSSLARLYESFADPGNAPTSWARSARALVVPDYSG